MQTVYLGLAYAVSGGVDQIESNPFNAHMRRARRRARVVVCRLRCNVPRCESVVSRLQRR